MKTLISLFFVICFSTAVLGQDQLGPRIEFIKDSNNTWSKLYVLSKAHIAQPENVSFELEEIIRLSDGKIVSKENRSSPYFVLTNKWPFLFLRKFTITRNYELRSNSIKEVSATDPIPSTGHHIVAWMLFIISLGLIISLHFQSVDDISSIITNYSVLLGIMITSHFFPSLLVFLIGIVLTTLLAALTRNWFKGYDMITSALLGSAVGVMSFLYGSRMTEGFWVFFGIITLVCVVIILFRVHKNKRLSQAEI